MFIETIYWELKEWWPYKYKSELVILPPRRINNFWSWHLSSDMKPVSALSLRSLHLAENGGQDLFSAMNIHEVVGHIEKN